MQRKPPGVQGGAEDPDLKEDPDKVDQARWLELQKEALVLLASLWHKKRTLTQSEHRSDRGQAERSAGSGVDSSGGDADAIMS